jgi:hypothetical protein
VEVFCEEVAGIAAARKSLIRPANQCHNSHTHMQGTLRAHIVIPADLLHEIDALVGPRGRTAFLLETAREELRRRKLLSFLEGKNSAWNEKAHPEENAAAWVRKLRAESERRTGRKQMQRLRQRKRK